MKNQIKFWMYPVMMILLFFIFNQATYARSIIVIKQFQTPAAYQTTADELFSKIKTIIARQKDFDYATAQDIIAIINNNYPEEKVEECATLKCLTKFKERLQLSYVIDGEITALEEMFSTRLIFFDLKNGSSYSFSTPLLPELENSSQILKTLIKLLNLKTQKPKTGNPLAESEQVLAQLEKTFIVKREINRRLQAEKNNLSKTLETLKKRYEKFKELATETEDRDNNK